MKIVNKDIIKKISAAKTIFELVANLYQLLDENVRNEVDFISTYIDENPDDEKGLQNPNFELLNDFFEEELVVFAEYSYSTYQSCAQETIRKMRNLPIKEFGDRKLNELSVVFCLLQAIDSAAQRWNAGYVRRTLGPLNGEAGRYLVYLRGGEEIHKDLIDEIGRAPRGKSGLSDCLHNFIVMRRTDLVKNAGVPHIQVVRTNRKNGESKLKVAVIPGIRGKHFAMARVMGSQKVITYLQDEQKEQTESILQQMGRAIEYGAEFIMLPEYSVSGQMLGEISRMLKSWKVNNCYPNSHLVAVFAGSTWTEEDNNVESILDAWGNNVGRYYKYSSYTKPTNKSKQGGRATLYAVSEGLKDPGKECTLIQVEKMGCILPAICRDVIDDVYTTELVKVFRPAFITTVAWSPSSGSFKDNFTEYANLYFANSIFCNGCGALDPRAGWYAAAMMVGKSKTKPKGDFRKIYRDKDGCADCDRMCSYLFEFDFAPDKLYAEDRLRITEIP